MDKKDIIAVAKQSGYDTAKYAEFEASSGKMEIEVDLGEVLLGLPIDEIKSIKYA